MKLSELGEFGLIARMARHLAAQGQPLVVGVGDDAAVLDMPTGERLVLTCDAMVEGQHFRSDLLQPEQIGRRAVGAALSDIAAMGGQPLALVATLALRAQCDAEWAEAIAAGIAAKAGEHDCLVAGGDTVRTTGPVTVDIAVVGTVPPAEVLLRSTALPGDVLVVSGTLGDSAAGMAALAAGLPRDDAVQFVVSRHADPQPRIILARALAAARLARAGIDVSDGLLQDAGHLAEMSGVRIVVRADALPISDACRAVAARLGRDANQWALAGGEDFELSLTVPPAQRRAALALGEEVGVELTEIGEVQEGTGVVAVDRSGTPLALPESGWNHFTLRQNPAC